MVTVRLLTEYQNPDYPNVVYGRGHMLDMDPDLAYRLSASGKVNVLDDTAPSPLLSHSATTTNKSATVSWSTSMATEGLVRYAPSLTPMSEALGVSDPQVRTDHSVTIDGLRNNTQYFYRIVARADGVFIESTDFTFTTQNLFEAEPQPA